MASMITLKRRIRSVRNMRQITKAMELVSASKLRKSQEYAQRSRDYRDLAYDLLKRLNVMSEVKYQPLFRKREVKNRLYIIVTSNMGLAGAYNANVLKLLAQGLQKDRNDKVNSHVIAIGSKGAQFVRRISGIDLMAVYPPFRDQPAANDVRPLLNTIISQYESEAVDDIQIIYTEYKSGIVQVATSLQLLPAPLIDVDTAPKDLTISNFEPDVETVIEQVTTRLVEAQVWQAILESLASEHAMRMIATKNATDNANDLIDDYTLELNTARQSEITQELAELSAGVEALNG
ncbi:MAG TPA: ATP synthase F1 subunit gamma [Candidatus Saccharimonadales bacterium]|nr:ATP synthase F1 subunit gamma [Candidatus Saccharimonadales bacterium]